MTMRDRVLDQVADGDRRRLLSAVEQVRRACDDLAAFADDDGYVFDSAANGARSMAEAYAMAGRIAALREARSLDGAR